MKRWRLPDSDPLVTTSLASTVMAGIGTDRFAANVLTGMQAILPSSHCTVFALGSDGRVTAISTASTYGEAATETAVEYVRKGFDQQDSNMVWLAKRKTPARSQTWLSHQLAEEVANELYRRVCYGDVGIRERVSVLLLQADGHRIALSLYRNLSFSRFTDSDFRTLENCAPLLGAAVTAHVARVHRATVKAALEQQIQKQLPHRERQVVAHILAGHTTKETAQSMSLSPTTVLTYRYRAFAKLGVRTQRDLLAMLNHLPGRLRGTDAAR